MNFNIGDRVIYYNGIVGVIENMNDSVAIVRYLPEESAGVLMDRPGCRFIVRLKYLKHMPERGLRSKVPGIIEDLSNYDFEPSYTIDKDGHIRIMEVSMVPKLCVISDDE